MTLYLVTILAKVKTSRACKMRTLTAICIIMIGTVVSRRDEIEENTFCQVLYGKLDYFDRVVRAPGIRRLPHKYQKRRGDGVYGLIGHLFHNEMLQFVL